MSCSTISADYLRHPIEILKLWDGGMSFHGGVIGTSLGILYFARKEKLPWLRIHDYVACCVPFGLFFGRLANFVNQELWGAPTTCAMGGPLRRSDAVSGRSSGPPRHPSQLYEAILEGLVLFAILWWMFWKTKARYEPGKLVGAFIFFYGLFRFGVEFIREPDSQLIGVRPGDRPAHGPMAVAADDPWRALPDADREEAPGAGRAEPLGSASGRVTPLERALRDDSRAKARSASRTIWRPATPIITRPAIRSARAAISPPRRKSARCSARSSAPRSPIAGTAPARRATRSMPSSGRAAERWPPMRCG